MAKRFSYYEDWKNEPLYCLKCGWTGTFESGEVELYTELMDCSCPRCSWPDSRILAIVTYPTLEETDANLDRLTDAERESFLQNKKWWERFERLCLVVPDQLPDLPGDKLILTWDFVEDERGEQWTKILCGRQMVWREPAVWEGCERFVEIVQILQQRYGHRVKDLAPTQRSKLFLLGDQNRAVSVVAEARCRLAESATRAEGS
jgi:hypothetical protein